MGASGTSKAKFYYNKTLIFRLQLGGRPLENNTPQTEWEMARGKIGKPAIGMENGTSGNLPGKGI